MASAGFEPANLGTKGQHATPRPPKPLYIYIYIICIYKYFVLIVMTKHTQPKGIKIYTYFPVASNGRRGDRNILVINNIR